MEKNLELRIILKRKNMTLADLANEMGISRQNLSNQLSRDNFQEKDILKILNILDCTYKNTIIINNTGEEI